MLIRKAEPDDMEALKALARRSVAGLSGKFYDTDQTRSAMECITAPDVNLIADGTMLVAEIDGHIVGCGAWSKRNKLYTGSSAGPGEEIWLDPAKQPARIRAFFVDPDFARNGIARKLYQACLEAARGAGFAEFELMATLPGVPLYKSLGFIAVEEIELDLTDGTKLPAIRMIRSFS